MSLNDRQFGHSWDREQKSTQLQMLMKPSEFQDLPGFKFGDVGAYGGSVDRMRDRKLREADTSRVQGNPSLTEGIETKGIRRPVTLDTLGSTNKTRLRDGHHRYFVAERQEQQGKETYVPVEYYR